MLEARSLSVVYDGAIVALDRVDFAVAEGSVTALLGPNGAGKTTLLKALVGMLPFERGEIAQGDVLFEGRSLKRAHPATAARLGIALVQDGRQCFRELTIEENLTAASYAAPKATRPKWDLVYELFPVLREMRRRPAGVLSGGQLQMLVIGMAIMMQPKALLLDEPSLGLSPVMTQTVFDAVERLSREARFAVVVAEQTVPRLLKMASDVYVLSRGAIVMHERPERLSEDALHRIYLS
jgi:branched-chain amino acid transport system ATP-binding protein